MSILNVDKIQPIGGGSTITVDATDIQASTGTIRASTFSGDISATGIGVTSLNITGVTTVTGKIDVVTAGTDVGLTVTQNGTGNILNLYDGSNLRFAVNQYGNPTLTSGNPVYASTNSSSSVTTTLFSNSAGQGVLQTNSGHSLILGTGAVEKLRITGNGHVNIGGDYAQTTYKFKVTGTSYFDGDVTVNGDELFIADSIKHVGDTDTLISFPSNDTIRFNTAGSERLRIRSDGKISAGTAINTSNTYEFSVTGSDSNGAIYGHGRNHYLSNRSNAYSSLTLKKSNADSDGIDYLQLRDSSNNLKGHITGAGNWKPIAGGGIDFSATSDAGGMDNELLDDYEEGSWTPTARNDGSFTSSLGRYVKIGQQVTVWGYIPTVTNNTSNNILQCSGLPFTVLSGGSTEYVGTLMIRFVTSTGISGVSFNTYTYSGRNYLEFFACRDDGNNYESIKHSDLGFTNSNGIRFCITYVV